MSNGDDDFDFSAEAEATNAELAAEIGALAPPANIAELLPKAADREKLNDLIKKVNAATTQNEKIAALTGNIQEFGGVVLKLVSKYLKPI